MTGALEYYLRIECKRSWNYGKMYCPDCFQWFDEDLFIHIWVKCPMAWVNLVSPEDDE